MPKLKFQGGYLPNCTIDITEEEQALLNGPPSEEREALCVALTERMYDEIDDNVTCGMGGIYITACEQKDFVDELPSFDPNEEDEEDES